MHELDFTTGRAAIAYTGREPWHRHGIKLTEGSTYDEWRVAAGLDYDVVSRPLFYGVESDTEVNADGSPKRVPVAVPDRVALLRGDTSNFLSIVSKDYRIHQPKQVFAFFQDMASHLDINLEVAGALDHGRKIWALARINDDVRIFGRDEILPYVLMATSYDTSLSTTAMYTSTRVVCMNTLRFSGAFTADGESADVYKVPHNREFVVSEAHGKLGLDEAAWLRYKQTMDNLARFTVSPEEALEYFYTIAGQDKEIVRNEDNGNILSFPEPGRVVKQFINAYHNGPGADLPSAKGTLFGALNAVTFYQDHLAPAGDTGKRFSSATFGGGNVRKQHAMDLAVAKFSEAVAA